MSDQVLLIVGVVVFGLMLVGLILTWLEFRKIPRRQEPQFDSVALQAQPQRPDTNKGA